MPGISPTDSFEPSFSGPAGHSSAFRLLAKYACGFRIPDESEAVHFLTPTNNEKTPYMGVFSLLVGVPGFEPGVIWSQTRHVSRYTTLRYVYLPQKRLSILSYFGYFACPLENIDHL